ncbi:FGGY-family carbohydrate kinase [Palleronia caenipelagi]|uniref:FGGY-family carbohydrate kinase n=1 Tax=Palleronia caenipelagi TaxID=2489174 RepID=A0A547PN69_9RHOB|nr:FGGY-family carbohydrate kinase [Palleronia caenipelagi]TRD15586.1 FGGY-family carbohydrate kinase [Palleronia caenipelagi]
MTHFIGIDVGTGSARAGVFDAHGQLLGAGKSDITLWHDPGHRVEQSSAEIWQAVCAATRSAVEASGVSPDSIGGIGFDATCSLVVLGEGGKPLPVGDSDDAARDIIVWMDHRALEQTARINHMGHRVLDYVGGVISPEMETPKLLWLKENKPESFDAAWQFFDLTDFLTWKATGSLARSICTVTCKWTYVAKSGGWDADYFREIGLGALANEGFTRIGTEIVEAGTALGQGLTEAAAADLGLRPGTPVGAGLIDAHAGGIGSVGANASDRLAYVFGTSSCTMTTTRDPVFVPGVWGPYYAAMVPGMWLNEGGQSAAGAAIAQLIRHHPAHAEAAALAGSAGMSLPDWLGQHAVESGSMEQIVARAEGLHVVPEFLGNRAPFADPNTRAVIAGLGMAEDVESLVDLYIAGLCGVAYGLRQIIEAQAAKGAQVSEVVISGGAGRSDLVRQMLADATGVPLAAPETDEPVLLGSAILGAVAGGAFPEVSTAMTAMSRDSATYSPASGALRQIHDARFAVFQELQAVARRSRTC